MTQLDFWTGEAGSSYTEDSASGIAQEQLFYDKHHVNINDLYEAMFADLDRDYRILEIGCNVGHNLQRLREMGFYRLYGLEPNSHAISIGRSRTDGIVFIPGTLQQWNTAETWDLVFTQFVLQHIQPDYQSEGMAKIVRLTNKYVFFLEFWDQSYDPIPVQWKERTDLTWKRDWVKYYQTMNLGIVREQMLPRVDGFQDHAALLIDQFWGLEYTSN